MKIHLHRFKKGEHKPITRMILSKKKYRRIAELIWSGYSRQELIRELNTSDKALTRLFNKNTNVDGIPLVCPKVAHAHRYSYIINKLRGLGFTNVDLAPVLGISRAMVSKHRARPNNLAQPNLIPETHNIPIHITGTVYDTKQRLIPKGQYFLILQDNGCVIRGASGFFILKPWTLGKKVASFVCPLEIRSIYKANSGQTTGSADETPSNSEGT